ncbi:MAG: DNA primase DnaG [Candidatus Micrarchaeota archaeon]|nr:DNA primase DnaG [Candidatus Micrarchaeota archaeon]
MGKTYVDTVKYQVKASFEISGIVERPDIVGAIFGQTEGLLGDELDLRELQKNGRIGRIEVDLQLRGGKSFGTVVVPSSLDMVETSILAAALEIVDRVGPCSAQIKVHRIEDSRNMKRKIVLDRAKALLQSLVTTELPESKQMTEMVREQVKVSEVTNFGADKLPAGPDVATSDEILVVEGRADVVNLLKNNIKNAVAVGGAKVNPTIIELCKQKEVTAFLDGDRGGDIILRELLAATEIDFVSRAPPGKEVEELSRKELIKAIRRKVPVEQVKGYASMMETRRESRQNAEKDMPAPFDDDAVPASDDAVEATQRAPAPRHDPRPERAERPVPRPALAAAPAASGASPLQAVLRDLEGSLKARFMDSAGKPLREVPIREIMKSLQDAKGVHAVVLDGIVTQRLLDLAEQKGVDSLVGIRAGNLTRKSETVKVILAE